MKPIISLVNLEKRFARNSPQHGVHVPQLVRDLARDLIGPHWVLEGLLAVTEVVAEIHKWKRDPKPQQQQRDHRRERDSSAGVLLPDEEVEEESRPKHDGRVEGGGLKYSVKFSDNVEKAVMQIIL